MLGVIKKFDQEIILADIPGLVEGAHEGKGLGDRFLAHIERCKILLHVIECSQNNLIESYQKIRNEIIQYGKNLAEKFEIIAISKSDLSKKNQKELQKGADDVFKKVKFGEIKIKVSKEYKLADAKLAHEDLESRKLTGPAVIVP